MNKKKNPAAVALAKLKDKKTSKKRRHAIAKHAAQVRWAKSRAKRDRKAS